MVASLLEAWVRGQRKMRQLLGAFGLLDFTMLGRPFSFGARFETYKPFIYLIFQFRHLYVFGAVYFV
jgi:hypothetical protein